MKNLSKKWKKKTLPFFSLSLFSLFIALHFFLKFCPFF